MRLNLKQLQQAGIGIEIVDDQNQHYEPDQLPQNPIKAITLHGGERLSTKHIKQLQNVAEGVGLSDRDSDDLIEYLARLTILRVLRDLS